PMTWNGHRQRVRSARLRHRAHRLRGTNPPRDLGIARGRSRRDAPDGVPYPPLKRGAANVERQIETLRGGIDEAYHLGHELLEGLVAAELRRRHAEQSRRRGVKSAAGVEARSIDRLGDGVSRDQLLAHAIAAMS